MSSTTPRSNTTDSMMVSLSPHVHGSDSVNKIMWTVVLALLPALGVSIWAFGIRSLIITLVAAASAMLCEAILTRFLLKEKKSSLGDGSALLTALLLSFNLPANIPLWQVVIGSVFAVAIGKMVFGGLGHNPFNPALVGRAFMLVSFPAQMSSWPATGQNFLSLKLDAMSSATPLAKLAEEGTANLLPHMQLFLGNSGGSLGEISSLAIIAGGLFLLARKIISWEIPVFFLGSLALFTGIFWLIDPLVYADPLFHLLSGGAMLGAWFMATDMVTSPMTFTGRIIYAVAIGILTGIIRLFGSFPEGVSYAILILNAFVPVIDKYVAPKRFAEPLEGGSK